MGWGPSDIRGDLMTTTAPITSVDLTVDPSVDPATDAHTRQRVALGGSIVDLMHQVRAVDTIIGSAAERGPRPLAVVSANLDHIHHFGRGARWQGVLEHAEDTGAIELLTLLDGMPLVSEAHRLTGRSWPRLAGSDLIGPILDEAERHGIRIGFLGGSTDTQQQLRTALATRRPRLRVTGWWSPPRAVLTDTQASYDLALEVAAAGVDLLVVGLGKPRQELWIAQHGATTGAGALLAFGAVVDFLADKVSRAPEWMSGAGLEWSYRLAQEPLRLSRRYLLDGPEAYRALRRSSELLERRPGEIALTGPGLDGIGASRHPLDTTTDITAIIVTHNSDSELPALLGDLRSSRGDLRLQVVVVDNASSDDTVTVARLAAAATEDKEESGFEIVVLEAPGNVGYAGGINHALESLAPTRSVLILNPDLRLEPGALSAMWRRLWQPGTGAVAPRLVEPDGVVSPSLRFEPGPLRTLGDALLGARVPSRPAWLTEIDWVPESYQHPHPIDWATGACLLVRADVVESVGAWDERYFLYSEEVDYLRRIRDAGWSIWFDPSATVVHQGGASGASPALVALESVNRVRYAEAVLGVRRARLMRAAALTGELLRSPRSASHRAAASALLSRRRWAALPAAQLRIALPDAAGGPVGTVVVPAYNEGAVISRTLAPLAGMLREDRIELVVAVNGSVDDTADRARQVIGAVVLDLSTASKAAALNSADEVATCWPRLYLDADIDITPRAVHDVLTRLAQGDVLAARPPLRYDTTGATWPVRVFYSTRVKVANLEGHLWGAGAYAMSQAGHERLGCFPDVTADDYAVDATFAAHEKIVVDTDAVVVRTPRTVPALLSVLRRTYRGNADLAEHGVESATARTVSDLIGTIRGPVSAIEVVVYAALVLCGRRLARRPGARWDRDDSSRVESLPWAS